MGRMRLRKRERVAMGGSNSAIYMHGTNKSEKRPDKYPAKRKR